MGRDGQGALAGGAGGRRAASRVLRSWPYWPVLTDPVLRLVLPGLAVSCVGDGMGLVAVPWLALRLVPGSGQGVWVAAAVAAYLLPGAVVALVLRRLLAGHGGARLAGWDATLRAVALGMVPVAAAGGVPGPGVYVGLLGVSSLLHVWGVAGRYSLIAQVLPDEHRLAANGLLSVLGTGGYVAGAALAGVLVAVTGPAQVIGADAATFAVLAVSYRLAWSRLAGGSAGQVPGHGRGRGGWRVIGADRRLLGLTVVTAMFYLVYGPVPVALPLYVTHGLHGSAAVLGWFWALFAVGEGIGGLAAGYLRRCPLWPVVAGVIAGWGVCLLPTGLDGPLWLALAGFAAGGLLYAPFSALSMALFQRVTPPGALTSVLAAAQSLFLILPSAGMMLGGVLVTTMGARRTLLGSALVTLILGGVTAIGVAVAGSRRRSVERLKAEPAPR